MSENDFNTAQGGEQWAGQPYGQQQYQQPYQPQYQAPAADNSGYYQPQDCNTGGNDGNNLGGNFMGAVVYFFTSLVYILFVCPFSFWAAAINRLANDRTSCRLDVLKSCSRWPYLSFCKKVFFEFAIDGLTFVSWFAGVVVAFIVLISGFAGGLKMASFVPFFFVLVGTYYAPLALALLRDLVVILLLPFSKFLSWVSKPAQHLDIDMTKK